MFHPLWYSYTPSAISSAKPTRPNITRHQFFSSSLTGVVVIGVNKSNTIWCSARNRVMGSRKLLILRWLDSNKTSLPTVDEGHSSDHEVYVERFAGTSDQDNAVWRSVLHFKRAQPSSAGNYTCVASYENNIYSYQTVDIQVSGEWSMWLPRMSVTNTGVNYNRLFPRLSLPSPQLGVCWGWFSCPHEWAKSSSTGRSTNSSLA